MRYSNDTVLDFIADKIQSKLGYTEVEVSDYDEDVGTISIIDRKNVYKLRIDFVKSIVLLYNEKGKLVWSNDTLDLVDDIEDTCSFIANMVARFVEKENKMNFGEAKEILNNNGFLVEKYNTEDKYVFKETDKEWFGEFLKRYDAYGNFGWGVEEKVESYSDGILTFENVHGYLDDDNTAEFSWFVDAKELFADKDDVKEFMASYKSKQSKRSGKKGKDWTATEIAKLIRDNGLSIDSIIDALKKGED